MTHKINGSDVFHPVASQVELDLLALLLEPEDTIYPWNPADDESEAYFDELERQFVTQDVLGDELLTGSQAFYNQLDNLWSEVADSSYYKCSTNETIIDHLQETLHTVFTFGVPQGWLKAIATKATEIFAPQQSMGEQLVQCVQAVLPTWESDDLLVLTRPFAYAMRSKEPQSLTSVVSSLENRDWVSLSETEQAKISVAIAYYALRELNDSLSEV